MNKDVQTLTPPSQAALRDCRADRQDPMPWARRVSSAPMDRKPLFTAANHRCDLLDEYPELAQVCDRLGFGESMGLGEWSGSCEWALLELARGAFPPAPPLEWDMSSAELSELITDIIEGHHRPLRNELRRIGILIEHWGRREANPLRTGLVQRYQEFSDHLLAHLDHEESVVFPQCVAIDLASRRPRRGARMPGEVTSAIRAMNLGHDDTERSLQQIRNLLDDITRSHPDADVAIIRIGLAEMAADLAVHASKESEYLVPAAIYAEDQVRARNGFR